MMTKMTVFSILGRKIAPALLLLLPAAAVCAQNAPASGTPASPAKTQQMQPAQPTNLPTSAAPAPASLAKTPVADTSTTPATPATTEPNRAQAYFHLALAGVYEDDAISDGRTDEVNKAIEEYKL